MFLRSYHNNAETVEDRLSIKEFQIVWRKSAYHGKTSFELLISKKDGKVSVINHVENSILQC